MWAKVESGSVTKVYTRPTAITVGNVNHPANIMQMWSASELEAIGIYPVVQDDSNLKNEKYYINGVKTVSYSSGTVTQSYGSATARSMTDTLFTAEDEAAEPLNIEGTIKTRGLKTDMKQTVNGTANGYIQETDWMVIREADGGTAMPSNIKTYRAAVRTKANTHCTSIDNAANVDALAALTFDWPAKVS